MRPLLSRFAAACIGVLLAAVLLAGCGGRAAPSGTASAPETIKIGAVMPLTGRYGAGGSQVRQGYVLAVEQVNAAGGVYVRDLDRHLPLELIVQDDESDPVKTVHLMDVMFDQHNLAAYFGGFGSDMHAAAAAISEKNKVPYLGVTFGLEQIHRQGYRYLFSPFPKSRDYAQIFAVLKQLMPPADYPQSVAIVYENTDWGLELGPIYREEAAAHGVDVVVYETYQPGTTDFSDIIGKAKAAGAELMVGMPSPPDGIALAKQAGELGFVPKAVFLVRAPDNPAWAESTGVLGDRYLFAPGWSRTATDIPGIADAVAAYEAKHGSLPPPNVGPGYAVVQLLVAAIEQAGSAEREAIREALTTIDAQTVLGRITFDEYGIGSAINFFTQWQDGEVVTVWPQEPGATLLYPLR